MTITNDERREVAARLRELSEGVLDSREYEHRAICAVVGCWGDGEYSGMELKDRLADLIEPEPEKTCKRIEKDNPADNECSECGFYLMYMYSYCPNCGARVVDSKDRI